MEEPLWPVLNDASPSITLFVGENGSGKSRRLVEIASQSIRTGKRVIAIANTVFDRFPRVGSRNYKRLTPSAGKSYAEKAFKRALMGAKDAVPRNAALIGRSLEYTGFAPTIGLHMRLVNQIDRSDIPKLLPTSLNDADLARINRAFSIYTDRGSIRQSMWVNMYGEHIGPDRRELLDLLIYESELKRAGIVESVSITIERGSSIYDLSTASSGELSLLATYAFLATNIAEGTIIFIDEPENSLHPRWQRDYCNHLFDQFYQYSPKVVIATHSPQVVQGAEAADIDVRVIGLPNGERVAEPFSKSIEGTLFEAFGVLSPASHYLSEKVTSLLNELAQGRADLESTTRELSSLIDLSVDEEQQSFLRRAIGLASTVTETIRRRKSQ